MADVPFKEREFPMSQADFDNIKRIAYVNTGINLGDHKKNMIYGRLARRLRALKITRFSDYCELIQQDDSPEMLNFINSITTNLTSFFRENHHFEYIRNVLIPALQSNSHKKQLRIWSAGCSTGEEPYSIALLIKSMRILDSWDIKILATDLDTNVVNTASNGIYDMDRVAGIDAKYRSGFQKSRDTSRVRVKDAVRELITFKQLNLLKPWPFSGPFDIIFCRNVVIYFDNQTQKTLFSRFHQVLAKSGYLFIGHSESLHNVTDQFENLGKTIYQRRG